MFFIKNVQLFFREHQEFADREPVVLGRARDTLEMIPTLTGVISNARIEAIFRDLAPQFRCDLGNQTSRHARIIAEPIQRQNSATSI